MYLITNFTLLLIQEHHSTYIYNGEGDIIVWENSYWNRQQSLLFSLGSYVITL